MMTQVQLYTLAFVATELSTYPSQHTRQSHCSFEEEERDRYKLLLRCLIHDETQSYAETCDV
jgi:hypothetical protein